MKRVTSYRVRVRLGVVAMALAALAACGGGGGGDGGGGSSLIDLTLANRDTVAHAATASFVALGTSTSIPVLSGPSGGMVGLLDSPASGEGTSAAFPAGAGPRRLCVDEPVMVDLGTVKNGYHMDETRMFAIGAMPLRLVPM